MKTKKRMLCSLVVVLLCAGSAGAVIYPLNDGADVSGWSIVIRSDLLPGGTISFPYVYDVTDEAVIIEIDKEFTRPPEYGLWSAIIVEFQKDSVDAVQNIIINDEFVTNSTGTEWTDYHLFLLVDALAPQAGFDPDEHPDGDQLEDVSYSQFFGYDGLPIQLNFENSIDGGVPAYPSDNNVFRPGVVSGRIVIVTDPNMPVYNPNVPGSDGRFGLKQVPTPEPLTGVLFGTGGLLLLRRRRTA